MSNHIVNNTSLDCSEYDNYCSRLEKEITALKGENQKYKDHITGYAVKVEAERDALAEENKRLQKFIDNWSMNKHDWQVENADLTSQLRGMRQALEIVRDYYEKCSDSCLIELSYIAEKALSSGEKGEGGE